MTERVKEWMGRRWMPVVNKEVTDAFLVTFSTPAGRRVLQHWMDMVYCTVYEGNDPIEGAKHHGRRSVVQETLEIIDQGEHPEKWEVKVETGGEIQHG